MKILPLSDICAEQNPDPETSGKRQEGVEIVRLLIAAGADPFIANKSGRKPRDYVKDDAIKSLLKSRRHK